MTRGASNQIGSSATEALHNLSQDAEKIGVPTPEQSFVQLPTPLALELEMQRIYDEERAAQPLSADDHAPPSCKFDFCTKHAHNGRTKVSE